MRQSPPAAACSPSSDLQRAEFASEVAQLRIIETLVAQHHHRVAVDRLRDRGDHGPTDTLAKIDAADSGDEVRIDRPYLDGHATSSISPGEDPPGYRASRSLEVRRALSRSRAQWRRADRQDPAAAAIQASLQGRVPRCRARPRTGCARGRGARPVRAPATAPPMAAQPAQIEHAAARRTTLAADEPRSCGA